MSDNDQAKPLFQSMGRVYKLLVDEKARQRREEDLLLRIAERARKAGVKRPRPTAQTRCLDLACGTGFHSRLLARAGYRIEALDAGESMLREARAKTAARLKIRYIEADLLEPLPVRRGAALALLLGNTLSLFEPRRALGRVLCHLADSLAPGGLALCQVLNFQALRREGARTVARHGIVDGLETSLVKVLQPADDGSILVHLAAAQRPGPGRPWQSWSKASEMQALEPAALRRAARCAGLVSIEEWGAMDGSPWQPDTSTDFVCLLEKRP